MSTTRLGRIKVTVVVLVLAIVVVAVALRLRDDAPAGGTAGDRADVPSAPASMEAVGTWIETEVAADGTVTVQQWIRSSTPIKRLQAVTPDPDSLPGTVEARGVVVRSMQGDRLSSRRAVGTKAQRLLLREPATDLYLRYTIAGETMSGESSTVAGRALVRVTSMDVAYDGESGPSVRVVSGPGQVLNLACLAADAGYDEAPAGCGEPADGGAWSVVLRGVARHDRVLAQLDDA